MNQLNVQRIVVAICFTLCSIAFVGLCHAEDNDKTDKQKKALKQVTYDIKYLASDEMGGRQPGTPGMKLAIDYIVAEYKKAGLKPLKDGTYLQDFVCETKRVLVENSEVATLVGPNGQNIEMKMNEHFVPLTSRKGYKVGAELVFVGYGISAEDLNYDEYANFDVEGKIVVVVRREPQANNDDSVFNGANPSPHSYMRAKVSAAKNAGAAAIMLVNNGDGSDDLAAPDQFGSVANRLPFIHVKREVIDKILASSPLNVADGKKLNSLAAVEKRIDEKLEPVSQKLEGWSANIKADFDVQEVKTPNIIGVIEGEGPNADETIVIGAHYDHLGMGAYGSRARGRKEIHNGADDNATGTAAVMELARRFNQRDKKPGRRLVFVCFSAEEMGLLGAIHYVDNPIFPLEKTVAMINFDMIGWLRNEKLTLYNWNTSPQFAPLFDAANEKFKFDLNKPASGFAGSDHLPFNNRSIPNVFIHTGSNEVYHTPEDDFEAVNCPGALKVIDYTEAFLDGLCKLEKRPTFGTPKPVRLGVMLSDDQGVVTIDGVTDGSLAQRAGLQKGDVILAINEEDIISRRQVVRAIRRDNGKTVPFRIQRSDAEMTLNIELKK